MLRRYLATYRPVGFLLAGTLIASLVATAAPGLPTTARASGVHITTLVPAAASCNGPYNWSVLNPRPIPRDLGPASMKPPIQKMTITTKALGAGQALKPVWWTQLRLTPAQVRTICNKHLTGVFLDWSGVPYNQAIRSGVRMVFAALGVKLLRITDYSFDPSGMAGDVAAILPLHPNVVLTGGTVNPSQFKAIISPLLNQGATLVAWSLGAPGLQIGPGKPQKAMVAYDFYHLGQEMAKAVHKEYPNGANLGYVHWINDVNAILLREGGFLQGLKAYPNIHIITSGGPANPRSSASGFTDPNGAQAYTAAFLQAHKSVNVLFAPWEDPPALGEAAAIKALHLVGKVHIVTMDLGNTGANQLRHGGIITVDMGQDVYDGGRSMALAGSMAASGINPPSFVIVPTWATTPSNVIDSWNYMHGPEVTCGSSCR